ncbi:autophagy protein [Volvox carteri f. nagariensis]|uniref:Autophagy-related protein 3 n=1 Tax=Volvox carteri f. nagariensis TaxID=3068 RepID=D8U1M2_VOLCA|nr:autophagy protein [Volvox carteri f. nagariensis]EFJ46364.1 autophagy protein [Volvox carteri f. nagariensis]|eukprot:XP_002952517.1 autophagy protein [Volvox carteri f. nagariensis]
MNVKHTLHTLFKSAVEKVAPPLSKSQFEEKRVLTPEEFVAAGDYLVHACPTWSWEGGDPKKRKSYLSAEKQFLVTRNVPCLRRATDVAGGSSYNPMSEFALPGEEGWVATHIQPTPGGAGTGPGGDADIPSMDDDEDSPLQAGPAAAAAGADAGGGGGGGGGGKEREKEKDGEGDIPDIGDLELNEGDDEAAAPSASAAGYLRAEEPADNIVRTRTYDLYITYDQYYQVPRFWLVGFDESRKPLLPHQGIGVMEDVSEEHARKTITLDPHPHLPGLSAASIHPCRHAETMKRLADKLVEGGRDFRVDLYLVLFLKFIASVVPTIQYDYTMAVGGD